MKEISKNEWWIGLIVAFIALAVAAIFEPAIKDGMLKEIKTYQQALRVENDPVTYAYAKSTNVGNVLAFGNITAIQPVFLPELKQAYGAILKIKEHYTQHERQVCDERDKEGNCTSYRTETYYEWDTVGRWRYVSGEWNFLDVKFTSDQLEMTQGGILTLNNDTMNSGYEGFYDGWHLYEQSAWGFPTGDDRYYFLVAPTSFACTVFSKFVSDTASDPISGSKVLRVWDGVTPAQIIQKKKDDLVVFDVLYYLLFVILCVGVWYYLAYDYFDIR